MANALIGHTGFVGSNLCRQHTFTDCYHSKNIEQIRNTAHELLVISGAPAVKWLANREPEADLENLQRLMQNLDNTEAESVVLISTIDVYPNPRGVDEETAIDPEQQHAYGRHRLLLEQFVQRRFANTLVLRLPGLFGAGLKKNAIYDFMHDNETHKIHCDAVYQFYNLDNLWSDITRMRKAGLGLVNVASEPFSIAEMTRYAFGFEFANRPPIEPACYDFRTIHDGVLGGTAGYLYSRDHVLGELRRFVTGKQAGAA